MNEPVQPGAARKCSNCGAPLAGRYCSQCGQEDHTLAVPLYRLILDFLSDQFQFDARIWNTLHLLLFRPGRLSRNYLAGWRQRYIPPVRLYLFISIVFFLVVGLFSMPLVHVGNQPAAHGNANAPASGTQITSVMATIRKAMKTGSAPATSKPGSASGNVLVEPRQATGSASAGTHPTALHKWLEPRIRSISRNPQRFMKQTWSNMPKALFFLIPVFALLMKVVYLLRKRYYSEHLIFALHYHSFLFFNLLLIALLLLAKRASPAPLAVALDWVIGLIGLWCGVYLFPAMRTVYRDGWFGVLWRGSLILFLYFMIAIWAAVGVVMATFALS